MSLVRTPHSKCPPKNKGLGALFVAFFAILLLYHLAAVAVSAACVSAADGNWSVGANWAGCAGAGGVPATTDAVQVSHNITLDTTTSIVSITIDSTKTLNTSGTPTLTLTGTTGTLFTNSGTFTPGTSIVVMNPNADVTLTSGTITFNTLQLTPTLASANRTYTFGSGAITINSNFTIQPAGTANSLTVNMGAAVTVTGTTSITRSGSATSLLDTTAGNHNFSTGVLTIAAAGSLNANGSTITVSGTGTTAFTNAGTFTYGTSTVKFTGTGATSIGAIGFNGTVGTNGYYNLEFAPTSGTPTYTLGTGSSQTIAINNNFTVGSGSTMTVQWETNDPTLNVGGNMTINANAVWTRSSTATLTFGLTANSVTYADNTSAIQTLGICAIGNGTLAKTVTLTGNMGCFTMNLTANASLDASSYTFRISGSGTPFTRTGTFTYGTSTVEYNGTVANTTVTAMSGTGGTNGYYNLTVAPTANVSFRLGTATLQTIVVNNNLTIGNASNSCTVTWDQYDPVLTIGGNILINNLATWTKSASATMTMGLTANSVTITDNNATTKDLGRVTIGDGSLAKTVTSATSWRVQILIITANSTLVGGANTIHITGTTTCLTVTGTFQYDTSTIAFIGQGATNVPALSGTSGTNGYYNLNIQQTGGTSRVFTLLGGTLSVNNNLTVGQASGPNVIQHETNDTTLNIGGNLVLNTSAGWTKSTTGSVNFTLNNNSNTWTDNTAAILDIGRVFIGNGTYTKTITPTTNVKATLLTINANATYAGGSFTTSLTGAGVPLVRNGTFQYDTSTINYMGTTAQNIIAMNGTVGTNGYYNLAISPAATVTHVLGTATSQTIIVNNDLFIGNGANPVTINHTTYDPALTIGRNFTIYNTALWTKSDTATIVFGLTTTTGTWSDANATTRDVGFVNIGDGSLVKQVNLAGSVRATTVNVTANATLGLGSLEYYLFITGGGTGASRPLIVSGTVDEGTNSVVVYNGTTTTEVEDIDYWHLGFSPAGTVTHRLGTSAGQTIVVQGDLGIGNGTNAVTVTAAYYNVTLDIDRNFILQPNAIFQASSTAPFYAGGDVYDSGTYTANNGTITLDGTVSQVLGGGNPTEFYNITVTNSSDAIYVENNVGMTGTLNMNGINTLFTLDPIMAINGGTITGTGTIRVNMNNGGTFETQYNFTTRTLNNMTVEYVSDVDFGISPRTYGNLKILPSADSISHIFLAGTTTVNGDMIIGNGTNTGVTVTAATYASTINVAGDITLNTNTTFVANGSNALGIGGDFSNGGTFTHNNGTVNLTGADATTQLISGNTTFYNLAASTTANSAGRTIQYAGNSTTTVAGTWTMSGASGKVLTLASSDTNSWTINPTAASVTYVNVSRSTNTGVSFCATYSTNGGNNTSWNISSGSSCGTLATDIVDGSGVSVTSPSIAMSAASFVFGVSTTTGTFGVSAEKIRVTNATANPQWSISVAANSGPTAFWDGAATDYDFNDPTSSAGDGSDSDSLGGQMSIDPSALSITPQGGCSATGISAGSSSAFDEPANTNSITLATASGSTQTGCYWDLTNVGVSQTIPAERPSGTYSIDMTISIVAI